MAISIRERCDRGGVISLNMFQDDIVYGIYIYIQKMCITMEGMHLIELVAIANLVSVIDIRSCFYE